MLRIAQACRSKTLLRWSFASPHDHLGPSLDAGGLFIVPVGDSLAVRAGRAGPGHGDQGAAQTAQGALPLAHGCGGARWMSSELVITRAPGTARALQVAAGAREARGPFEPMPARRRPLRAAAALAATGRVLGNLVGRPAVRDPVRGAPFTPQHRRPGRRGTPGRRRARLA